MFVRTFLLKQRDVDIMDSFIKKTTFTVVNGLKTGTRSAVGNVFGYRCVSDCRSRGHEFDPGPVPYFRGD